MPTLERGAGARSLRAEVWRAYFESSARLTNALEQALRAECDLSLADYNVLLTLSEAPGHAARMGEIADAMVFSPSRLTYQVQSMERRGLVCRERAGNDGRGRMACLTEAGAAAFRRAAVVHARHVRDLFLDAVADADLATLHRVFGTLDARLRAPDASALDATALEATGPARGATTG